MNNNEIAEPVTCISLEIKAHLLFMALLSIGFIGFWMFWLLQRRGIGLLFAHMAALGVMGFFGCWAGALAEKKGHGFWKAFKIGFFLPILVGSASAFLYNPTNLFIRCGGWEALATGLGVVIVLAVKSIL